jgi:hypothetical protein
MLASKSEERKSKMPNRKSPITNRQAPMPRWADEPIRVSNFSLHGLGAEPIINRQALKLAINIGGD